MVTRLIIDKEFGVKMIDKKCDPRCGDDEYCQPWVMMVDNKPATSCKESWGAISCPVSPANKKQKGLAVQ